MIEFESYCHNKGNAMGSGKADSQNDFERFRELVIAEPALRKALLDISDSDEFISLAIRLGQNHGCKLSVCELQAALDTGRRSWLERTI